MVRSDQAYEGGDLTLLVDLIGEGNLAYEGKVFLWHQSNMETENVQFSFNKTPPWTTL